MSIADGRLRVVLENVEPAVDGGRHPIKRVVGEKVRVEADLFGDGHDKIAARLLSLKVGKGPWSASPMAPTVNDRWAGEFEVTEVGQYSFKVEAWVDHYGTWAHGLRKKFEDGQDVAVELHIGVKLLEQLLPTASVERKTILADVLGTLKNDITTQEKVAAATKVEALSAASSAPAPNAASETDVFLVTVDRPLARSSAWYEFFPRSAGDGKTHGTFQDCIKRLPYVKALGFDIIYFPPIHPVGHTFRKGRNNTLTPEEGDVGSPWAIGNQDGGHKAINPALGTLEDFRKLVAAAKDQGISIALDIAFQCSPDHPYVKEHPEWFSHRPDGTIQYAENPPKKYQDIYPFNFECEEWRSLWNELASVFAYWADQGVRVFRVDNPHTKPLTFWEWCIDALKLEYPDLIFLSEAFTRPKVMKRLAKVGFTQSYTYFAWRNAKWEIEEYFTELSQSPSREYFRPNPWPNTPDILTDALQYGGENIFLSRFVLAATLGANYGIYGPAFESMERRAVRRGSEEYLDSEKYQLREWAWDAKQPFPEFIGLVNRVRKEHPALQRDWTLRFHGVDNDQIIAYSKRWGDDIILVVVNLDPHHGQHGWLHFPGTEAELGHDEPFRVKDLLTNAVYNWQGSHHYVGLESSNCPAHIFQVRV